MEGKNLGPNFIRRLLRLLTWGEQQMGAAELPPRPSPQVLQPSAVFGKLDSELTYNDATGVTMSIWRGKPAVDTTDDLTEVIASELLLTSGSLAAGKGVLVQRIDGRWYVIAVACP
jgi:hypothetical protein